MSRQQTRPSGDGAIDPSLVQKKRARHRLVGAVCLSLLAAVLVPLVLESEPRPRDRELPIELAASARDAAQKAGTGGVDATGGGAPPGAAGSPASGGKGPEPGAVTSGAIGSPPAPLDPAASGRADGAADAANTKSAVKTVTPPAPFAAAPAASSPQAGAVLPPAARQQPRQAASTPEKPPLAQDKPPTRSGEPDVLARLIERADTSGGGQAPGGAAAKTVSRKFLVQIGAYSNVQSARSVSDRAVQVGLRPYQETVKTAQGDWIRVRVGPFTSRQDAERAQQDLKRAGVTAAIIAL